MSNDAELMEIVDAYLAEIEAGRAPDRDRLLAEHPDLKERLEACLASLDFIRGATPPAGQATAPGDLAGHVLGDYRIVREIGRGGMGVVYEAEQVSLRRRVALKVLPFAAVFDQKHLERFRNEAQAAALLHHTHIVPVFAVGNERGVHYYAMQYIEGRPLSVAIRELRDVPGADDAGSALSPGSSTRTRAFFRAVAQVGVDVAEALHYAHEEGVVHRDIKPGNILIDERGKPWVTDFGLAKLRRDPGLTVTGDLIGTMRYMSPEQALAQRAVVDERTDVYSLGVTLYELITQRPAFPGDDPHEILRQIAFDEPRYPSRVNRAMPAELETIVLKAIAKIPAERYATARELADDLRRFLDHKPIVARRPSLADRTMKWARRNRALVGAGMVVLVLAVIGLTISNVLVAGAQRRTQAALKKATRQERLTARALAVAKEERAEAQRQALIAERINWFLTNDILGAAQPERFGRDAKVRDALGFAAREIQGKFRDEPLVEAALRRAIGHAYFRLGVFEKAAAHLRRAWRLRTKVLGPEHVDTLDLVNRIAEVQRNRGLLAEAETMLREALPAMRRSLGEDHAETINALHQLAIVCLEQNKLPLAETYAKQAVELRTRRFGLGDLATLDSRNVLAVVWRRQGRMEEAERYQLETLRLSVEHLGEDHPSTAVIRGNLAVIYVNQGRAAEGAEIHAQILETQERVYGKEHPETLTARNNLGTALNRARKHAEAARLHEETHAISKRVLGEDHPSTLNTLHNWANALEWLYSLSPDKASIGEQAERLYEEALERKMRVLGKAHAATVTTLNSLGNLLSGEQYYRMERGDLEGSAAAAKRYLDLQREFDTGPGKIAAGLLLHGEALIALGRYAEAEKELRESYRLKSTVLEPNHWLLAYHKNTWGAAVAGLGRYKLAESMLLTSHRTLQADPKADALHKTRSRQRLAKLYAAWGKPDTAAEYRD